MAQSFSLLILLETNIDKKRSICKEYTMAWIRELFSGRLSRANYIISICLLVFIFFLLISLEVLIGVLLNYSYAPIVYYPITYGCLTVLQFFVFSLHVRRLHDLGRSGWWSLAFFIPFIGIITLIVLLCAPGDEKENTYGKPEIPNSYDVLRVFYINQGAKKQTEQTSEISLPPPPPHSA